MKTKGLHHVTGIAGDAQRNLDFYVGVLGLRFVKKTVNFDDPFTYHFYFGDEVGRPGSVLTFFPWSNDSRQGRPGVGQTERFAFAIPRASLDYWKTRLKRCGVQVQDESLRFDEPVISFRDYEGMLVELVGVRDDERDPWDQVVPHDHAIRGFHSVTLLESTASATGAFLRDHLGLVEQGTEGTRIRFSTGGPGGTVDLRIDPGVPPGQWGKGTIHHVAFRTPDGDHQRKFREHMVRAGIQVTPVIDRQYFRSVYFHEPGGVLLELATDGPGFATDETVEALGTSLRLPPWYEPERGAIESNLPLVVQPEPVSM